MGMDKTLAMAHATAAGVSFQPPSEALLEGIRECRSIRVEIGDYRPAISLSTDWSFEYDSEATIVGNDQVDSTESFQQLERLLAAHVQASGGTLVHFDTLFVTVQCSVAIKDDENFSEEEHEEMGVQYFDVWWDSNHPLLEPVSKMASRSLQRFHNALLKALKPYTVIDHVIMLTSDDHGTDLFDGWLEDDLHCLGRDIFDLSRKRVSVTLDWHECLEDYLAALEPQVAREKMVYFATTISSSCRFHHAVKFFTGKGQKYCGGFESTGAMDQRYDRLPELITNSSLSTISLPAWSHSRNGLSLEEQLGGRLGPALMVKNPNLKTFELGDSWPKMLQHEVLQSLSTPKTNSLLSHLSLHFGTIEDLQEVTLIYLPSVQLRSTKFCVFRWRDKLTQEDFANFIQQATDALKDNTMLCSLEIVFHNRDSEGQSTVGSVRLPNSLGQTLERNRFLYPIQQGPIIKSNEILGAALGRLAAVKDASCAYHLIRHKSTFLEDLDPDMAVRGK